MQNNNKYEITDWNIINLIQDEKTCCFINKQKCCKHKAKYSKEDKHYCKIHAKKQQYKIPTSDLEITKLKRMSLFNICNTINNYDISYTKPITKTFLLQHIEEQIEKKLF